MNQRAVSLNFVFSHPWTFTRRVIKAFLANQGFLLAGAVAYYTLLSIVPMFALLLIGLSQVVAPELLIETMSAYIRVITPGNAQIFITQLQLFFDNWKVVGVTGLVFLLFFSSLAFTVLENAMSVIFFRRVVIRRRHFLVSAIIPYLYLLFLAGGMLAVSLLAEWLHAVDPSRLNLLGVNLSMDKTTAVVLYLMSIFGEVLLLTSLYLVMPVGKLRPSYALVGGVVAMLLWEIARKLLIWYFASLSFVNVIYGSFATSVVILLCFEVAAFILLFGAQVIAEYEQLDDELAAG